MSAEKKKNSTWLLAKPFVLGGLSGMSATCIIQPIDFVKVQLQLLGKNNTLGPFAVASKTIKEAGFFKLYTGLSAALVRQATYTTARLGLFRTISNVMSENGKRNMSLGEKAVAGLTAGGLAAVVGTPADLALLRMQADSSMQAADRRNYKNVVDALVRIVKEEGFTSMWKGCTPTVVRAMSLNMGMLASYDQAKEELTKVWGASNLTNITASMIAGFLASAFSLPFDFVKTKVQQQKAVNGVLPYKNMLDCARKVIINEGGPFALYTGFPTYVFRIGPHSAFTLLFLEELGKLSKKYVD